MAHFASRLTVSLPLFSDQKRFSRRARLDKTTAFQLEAGRLTLICNLKSMINPLLSSHSAKPKQAFFKICPFKKNKIEVLITCQQVPPLCS
mmetsp:Transcript_8613/g.12507  ORF Transcript_8613/g.12507 Transcript_8613/m.12507 type:complete len:91 (-) Transcript_8613:681-953(-)